MQPSCRLSKYSLCHIFLHLANNSSLFFKILIRKDLVISSASTKLRVSVWKESPLFTLGQMKQLGVKGRRSVFVEHFQVIGLEFTAFRISDNKVKR